MDILFDAEFLKERPRGIAKSTLCLYRACTELDPSIRFTGITRKGISADVPDLSGAISCIRIRPSAQRDLWRYLAFNGYVLRKRPAAVHFPANGLVPRLHRTRNIVMTLHDVVQLNIPGYFSSDREAARFRERRQRDIDRSRIVLTVSEHSKKEILRHFRLSLEPLVIYNAPTLAADAVDPIMDIERTAPYFLYTGTYDPRKGLERLISVHLDLYRTGRLASKLYVAGERSYISREFDVLMAEAVAAGAVIELGYVPDPELAKLLNGARGLIYPSRYEGFGMPPLEAMQAGCPVITTPFASLPEVCGDAALYIDPEDGNAFGEAMIALDGTGALRRDLIVKGLRQAKRFSWRRSAERFLQVLSGLPSR